MNDAPAYRHILLAVTLTPACIPVAARAMTLARQYGAQVSVMHVVAPVDFSLAGEEMLSPQSLEMDRLLLVHAEKRLAELAGELGEGVTSRVEIGYPRQEIPRVAREIGADLIVLGSHDRHGLELLLGSTVDGVVHRAPCDVLAVHTRE